VSQQLTPEPAGHAGEILADRHRLPQPRPRERQRPAGLYIYRPGSRRKIVARLSNLHGRVLLIGIMADMQVADVRKLIDGLRWDRRRHPCSGRREYSQRAQAVAAAVADLIEAGDAVSAGPLARRAVERVTAALMYMDDSAGIVGDDLRTLMALYARSCWAAPPDAGRLAAWLVSIAARRTITTTSSSAMPPSRQASGLISVAWRSACSATGPRQSVVRQGADLRQRHRRKTSFITRLDKALVRR
jgi:hypothetical protein